jgi:hypothetical protein
VARDFFDPVPEQQNVAPEDVLEFLALGHPAVPRKRLAEIVSYAYEGAASERLQKKQSKWKIVNRNGL